MSSSPTLPDREQEAALHRRLVEGDPVASADVAIIYLSVLTDWLQACNRGIDPHFCVEAAGDAILSLIHNPSSYRPTGSESSLHGYLRMSARGDLLNRLQRENRHQEKRVPWKVVEVDGEAGNYPGTEAQEVASEEDDGDRARQAAVIARERERMSDIERKVFELMQRGERSTAAFAAVLGVLDRPLPEQEREAKRVKERMMKRLKRAGGRL